MRMLFWRKQNKPERVPSRVGESDGSDQEKEESASTQPPHRELRSSPIPEPRMGQDMSSPARIPESTGVEAVRAPNNKTSPSSSRFKFLGGPTETPNKASSISLQQATGMVMVMGDKGVGKSSLVSRLNDKLQLMKSKDLISESASGKGHGGSPSVSSCRLVEWNEGVASSLLRLREKLGGKDKPSPVVGCPSPEQAKQPADIAALRLVSPQLASKPKKQQRRRSPPAATARDTFTVPITEELGDAPQEMSTIAAEPLTQAAFAARRQADAHQRTTTAGLRQEPRPLEKHRPAPLTNIPKHSSNQKAVESKKTLAVQAFILCYDIGNSASFFYLAQHCLLALKELSGPGKTNIFVVGTKKDTANTRREVLSSQGRTLAASLGGQFLEVGYGDGTDELVTKLRDITVATSNAK